MLRTDTEKQVGHFSLRDNSFNLMNGLRGGQSGNRGSIPIRNRYFPLLRRVGNVPETRTASYPVAFLSHFTRRKTARE
jgi:hypothetical protein